MSRTKCVVAVLLSGMLAACTAQPQKAEPEKEIALSPVQVTLPSGIVEYVDMGGSGVPVLLLHPAGIRLWQHQIPAFAKAGYRVIAIDSRNLAPGAPYETPFANKGSVRLDEFVNKFGLAKFHVVGTVGNGPMTLQYAMAHPDKVRSVVLANTLGGLRDADINALEASLRPAPFNDMPKTFRELGASYRAANQEGTQRWLQLDNEGRAVGTQPPSGQGGPPAAPPSNDSTVTIAKLEAWQLPTILITGDADLYTPPSMMRIFVSHLKNGTGAVISGAGHNAYWENPEEFNRAVLDFIRKY